MCAVSCLLFCYVVCISLMDLSFFLLSFWSAIRSDSANWLRTDRRTQGEAKIGRGTISRSHSKAYPVTTQEQHQQHSLTVRYDEHHNIQHTHRLLSFQKILKQRRNLLLCTFLLRRWIEKIPRSENVSAFLRVVSENSQCQRRILQSILHSIICPGYHSSDMQG